MLYVLLIISAAILAMMIVLVSIWWLEMESKLHTSFIKRLFGTILLISVWTLFFIVLFNC